MKSVLQLSSSAGAMWLILRYGFPSEPVKAINNSTYSVELAAAALLAIAASIFVALKRMRP